MAGDVVRAVHTLLDAQGIEPSPENMAQLIVMLDALKVYNQRSQVYGMAWQQYGALSNLLNAARKTDRLMEVWWNGYAEILTTDPDRKLLPHKDDLDDGIDLINYTVFFIRNVRARNFTGTVPKRPTEEHLRILLGKDRDNGT